MPVKSHRIPAYQTDSVFSRNATNNAFAVINQKLKFCTYSAQCHHHTRIVVACTRPRNFPANSHRAPPRNPHTTCSDLKIRARIELGSFCVLCLKALVRACCNLPKIFESCPSSKMRRVL